MVEEGLLLALEVAMVNSYILFKFTNSSYTHVQYRKSVVESLAKCYFQSILLEQ